MSRRYAFFVFDLVIFCFSSLSASVFFFFFCLLLLFLLLLLLLPLQRLRRFCFLSHGLCVIGCNAGKPFFPGMFFTFPLLRCVALTLGCRGANERFECFENRIQVQRTALWKMISMPPKSIAWPWPKPNLSHRIMPPTYRPGKMNTPAG